MGIDIKVEHVDESNKDNFPKSGQTCVMHYIGKLENGTEFDSSYKKNRPFKFVLGQGQVIEGWEQGIAKMSKGEKAVLTISSDLAYGPSGIPGIIPPNATLVFQVHLEDFY